ncbi:TPA: DUF3293 domain-containing protein [Vibrio metoecus]
MMTIYASLWQAYKSVSFSFEKPVNWSFYCIITAWNPRSIHLSDDENCVNNQRLQQCLIDYDWVKVRVGDAHFHWFEDSFAVAMPLSEARLLAQRFAQNAIYYVQDRELYLCSCVDDHELYLGPIQNQQI